MGLPKTAPGPKYDPIQLQKEIQRLQTEDRGIEGEKILRKNTWKFSKQLFLKLLLRFIKKFGKWIDEIKERRTCDSSCDLEAWKWKECRKKSVWKYEWKFKCLIMIFLMRHLPFNRK